MSDAVHRFVRLHHIQVSIPAGKEDVARAFYSGILGMTEIAKPPVLAQRGGVWFLTNAVELHLRAEQDFRPAQKTHPAFVVDHLDSLAARLTAYGAIPQWDEDFPGYRRFYADDSFGNRLEFLEPMTNR
jgi:catechol 2,3-dioxygenase-like lactoylglutathione lyase family enzyme